MSGSTSGSVCTRRGARVALCLALLLAACRSVPDPEAQDLYDAALDLAIERSARAQRVGQAVSLGGAGICPETRPVAGFSVLRVDGLQSPLRAAAERRFGSSRGVFVTAVFEGSPASDAGLQAGDRILHVAGRGPRMPAWQLLHAGVRAMTPLVLPEVDGDELRIAIERGTQELELAIPVRSGCAYPVSLAESDAVNAFAWREQVVLLSGLLRFLPRDDALALVIAHEIAHVVLGHTRRNLGSSLRVERDADYLGAYLASRAGFELDAGDYALVQLAYEDPTQLAERRASSHPSGPERQLAFERALEEIRRKSALGSELRPEGLQ